MNKKQIVKEMKKQNQPFKLVFKKDGSFKIISLKQKK